MFQLVTRMVSHCSRYRRCTSQVLVAEPNRSSTSKTASMCLQRLVPLSTLLPPLQTLPQPPQQPTDWCTGFSQATMQPILVCCATYSHYTMGVGHCVWSSKSFNTTKAHWSRACLEERSSGWEGMGWDTMHLKFQVIFAQLVKLHTCGDQW